MSEPTPEERGTKLWASDRAQDAERGTIEARAREALELAVSYGVPGAMVTPDPITALTAAGIGLYDIDTQRVISAFMYDALELSEHPGRQNVDD